LQGNSIYSYCKNLCRKSCQEQYYSLRLDNNHYLPRSDSIINITFNYLTEYQYKAENSLDFIIYLSNIGGLLGLWLRLSVIHMNIVLKIIIKFIKTKILLHLKIIIIYILNRDKFQNIFSKLKTILVKLERYNYKLIFKLISIPIICIQMTYSLIDYLSFSTL